MADTAIWIYSAGAVCSLALAFYAFLLRQPLPFLNGMGSVDFCVSDASVLLMALTLIFGLVFTIPLLRKSRAAQAKLSTHAAKLEVEVVTDPLTGLHNRRYFEQALDEYLKEFTRVKAPLALLTLDLDHFKSVNDTYGHDAGDTVLKQISERLRRLTREHDIVARTGGEEFCIIAPFAREDQIRPFAERVCRMIGEMGVDLGHVILRPTVSIGVASTSDGVRTPQQLIKLSDERLYRAKGNGRNRVEF